MNNALFIRFLQLPVKCWFRITMLKVNQGFCLSQVHTVYKIRLKAPQVIQKDTSWAQDLTLQKVLPLETDALEKRAPTVNTKWGKGPGQNAVVG